MRSWRNRRLTHWCTILLIVAWLLPMAGRVWAADAGQLVCSAGGMRWLPPDGDANQTTAGADSCVLCALPALPASDRFSLPADTRSDAPPPPPAGVGVDACAWPGPLPGRGPPGRAG